MNLSLTCVYNGASAKIDKSMSRPLDHVLMFFSKIALYMHTPPPLSLAARIPVTWEERAEAKGTPWDVSKGSWPLIFMGGPTATSNPEPFAMFGGEVESEIALLEEEKKTSWMLLLLFIYHLLSVYMSCARSLPS